jgi:hypothetical protein
MLVSLMTGIAALRRCTDEHRALDGRREGDDLATDVRLPDREDCEMCDRRTGQDQRPLPAIDE